MKISKDILKKIKNNLVGNVLVVGDVMLDTYWFGDVSRISPEAPVPIAKINSTENRPGGAANVARNIANLGVNVTLLSVIGNDSAGKDLQKLLSSYNINNILKVDNSITTIIKLRILAKNQQLLRADFEKSPSHEILLEVMDSYSRLVQDHDIIVLSDYGKGGLLHIEKMITIAKKYNKMILIDPKGNDFEKYKNANILTPNKNELLNIIGPCKDENDLILKSKFLKNKLNIDNILLTRSEEGMTLFEDNQIYSFPTLAREVYDVSGAGDTVIATLAAMLANQIDLQSSVILANVAAGIVIAKVGTATYNKDELIDQLELLEII